MTVLTVVDKCHFNCVNSGNQKLQKSTMKKHNENYFVDKFRLLNSQETSEEISWSCSDSSDEDHMPSGKSLNITYGKRKKSIRKRKELRNISNLDITIVEPIKENSCAKSPILVGKSRSEIKSPILTPSQSYIPRFMTKAAHRSPVSYNNIDISKETRNLKSPIILLKRESPKISPKVKKKLFDTAHSPSYIENLSTRSTSPILNSNLDYLDGRKSNIQPVGPLFENVATKPNKFRITERTKNLNDEHNIPYLKNEQNVIATNQPVQPDHRFRIAKRMKNTNEEQEIPILNNVQSKTATKQPDQSFRITERTNPNEKHGDYNLNNEQKNSKFEIIQSSSSDSATNTSRTELVARVKSYFDNYFSSQVSNHSISEYETPTPSSKSSEEIENINDITQVKSLSPSLKDAPTTTSFGSNTNTIKLKKVKYKKGGLAYRLNGLLKKQNANISLWQHERFLAANSNFVIPKEEFLAFRIKNVDFNYNIYSIDVVNEDNEHFLVVINSIYVNNNSFEIDDVLKVYKPYKIIDCKIIVNVCKFVCKKLN